MRKLVFILLMLIPFFLGAEKLAVSQVFNPKLKGDDSYVSDVKKVLDLKIIEESNNRVKFVNNIDCNKLIKKFTELSFRI